MLIHRIIAGPVFRIIRLNKLQEHLTTLCQFFRRINTSYTGCFEFALYFAATERKDKIAIFVKIAILF